MSGKLIKRQGASKSKVEIDDIAELFKKLSESSRLPMFIGTSNMIIKTPVYNVDSDICDNSRIATRLKVLEEYVSSLITMYNGVNNGVPMYNGVNNGVPMYNGVNNGVPMYNGVNNGVPMYNGVNNGSLMNNVSSTPTNMT